MTTRRCFLYTILTIGLTNLCVFFSPSAQAQEPPIQESNNFYGLTPEEQALLNKDSKEFVEKFKGGRAEDWKKPNTRNFNILTQHDHNGDGVTDHSAIGLGASTLEAVENKAAKNIGEKDGGKSVEDNIKKWRDEQEKLTKCREKLYKLPAEKQLSADQVEAVCYQPSPNLVNVGGAHDGPNDSHRIYQMTEEAIKGAKDAGKAYADRAWAESANYKGNPDVRKGSKSGMVQVRAFRNGKEVWEEKEVGTNPDLIQSEVAWLEEHKQINLTQNFKVLRARNLARAEFKDDNSFDETVADAYHGTTKEDIKKGDEAVMKLVAEKRVINTERFCWNDKTASKVPPGKTDCGGPDKPAETIEEHRATLEKATALNKDGKKLTVEEQTAMRESAIKNLDKDGKDLLAKEGEKIKKCLTVGMFCNKSDLSEAKTEDQVGASFRDSREYVYGSTMTGNRGSLKKYEKDMNQNYDFRGNKRDLADFNRQVKDAQKQYADFLKEERDREADAKQKGGSYQSPYLNTKNFDVNTMSTRELSGRRPSRGDATFSNTPYPGSGVIAGPNQVQGGSVGAQPTPGAYPANPRGSPAAAPPVSSMSPSRGLAAVPGQRSQPAPQNQLGTQPQPRR